jgi:lysophospholipase L1-like esterase
MAACVLASCASDGSQPSGEAHLRARVPVLAWMLPGIRSGLLDGILTALTPRRPQERSLPAAPSRRPTPTEVSSTAPEHSPVALTPRLPRGKTVLHIGDSFAGALGLELNQQFAQREVKGVVKFETATYIPTWASGKRLDGYLTDYKPDMVMITLGGNDLEIADPDARVRSIRRLVTRLNGVPCVWVGIPLWRRAPAGLLRVIADNVAPCLYLDSSAAVPNLERAKDGIHPSPRGRRRWAEAVVEWLEAHTDPRVDDRWAWLPSPQPTTPSKLRL